MTWTRNERRANNDLTNRNCALQCNQRKSLCGLRCAFDFNEESYANWRWESESCPNDKVDLPPVKLSRSLRTDVMDMMMKTDQSLSIGQWSNLTTVSPIGWERNCVPRSMQGISINVYLLSRLPHYLNRWDVCGGCPAAPLPLTIYPNSGVSFIIPTK